MSIISHHNYYATFPQSIFAFWWVAPTIAVTPILLVHAHFARSCINAYMHAMHTFSPTICTFRTQLIRSHHQQLSVDIGMELVCPHSIPHMTILHRQCGCFVNTPGYVVNDATNTFLPPMIRITAEHQQFQWICLFAWVGVCFRTRFIENTHILTSSVDSVDDVLHFWNKTDNSVMNYWVCVCVLHVRFRPWVVNGEIICVGICSIAKNPISIQSLFFSSRFIIARKSLN